MRGVPVEVAALLPAALLLACAPRVPPVVGPAPALRFEVLGNASPSDTGAPTLRLGASSIVIRGLALQLENGGLYGDLDVTEAHTIRLTLYDSLPGRPVNDPPPPSRQRQVIYQAEVGPLAPGGYDVWVGRFDARRKLVEVSHAPLRIEIEGTNGGDSVGGVAPSRAAPSPTAPSSRMDTERSSRISWAIGGRRSIMPLSREDVRAAVERAGDADWRALIAHHEDAYPASRPTPGDVCRAEADRLNQAGYGDTARWELLDSHVRRDDGETTLTLVHRLRDRRSGDTVETPPWTGYA
ncbi:MAG TPA: hypothetical protein VMY76_14425 [Gemmatimonadales bacterium]|nr:hypothetical protein [Gemmatimonadales bacterium]